MTSQQGPSPGILHGFVVFDARTGTMHSQRRLVRGFGLPGAQGQSGLADPGQPGLADPVGLALQLFAFNRFCGNLPGAPSLERLGLGLGSEFEDARSVSFANAQITDPAGSGRELELVLALFSAAVSPQLGQRLAQGLLNALIVELRGRAPPAAEPKVGGDSDVAAASGGITARNAMSSLSSAKIGPAAGSSSLWRFRSLPTFLDSIPDLLVDELLDKLPCEPAWVAVLTTDTAASSSTATASTPRPIAVQKAGSAVPITFPTVGAAPPASPRPHAELPPVQGCRGRSRVPSLASRVLQTVSSGRYRPGEANDVAYSASPRQELLASDGSAGGSSNTAPRNTARVPMPRTPRRWSSPTPQAASHSSGGASSSGTQQVRRQNSLARGKVSWWHWRRDRSHHDRDNNKDTAADTAVETSTQQWVTSQCYFYETASPSRSRTADNLGSSCAAAPPAGGLAAFLTVASRSLSHAKGLEVVALAPDEWPAIGSIPTCDGERRAAILDIDGRLAVVLPYEAMIDGSAGTAETATIEGDELAQARTLRRALDPEMRILARHFGCQLA